MLKVKPNKVVWGSCHYLVDIEDFVSSGFKPVRRAQQIFLRFRQLFHFLGLISEARDWSELILVKS